VAGFRYQEIAILKNIPYGTVMSRLHRGRRRLRMLLGVGVGQDSVQTLAASA
jgi:RNA polymerase sigma-70 factor (ECF subfamily)